uniref:hypothetical protein n=1 Tax=Candidatus Electronema sp. TaxID=2698783 RepID=UPI0040565E46
MATIQWRPEVNALTTPQSYRMLFLPRNVAGKADMAARMAKVMPNYSEEEFRAFIDLHNQLIRDSLLNGEQVTEENAFTYSLSFTGKLDSPDDPLPPLDECLQVRVRASTTLTAAIRQNAKTERLPEEKKLPLISTAQDTVLGLRDVLNPAGLLRLIGEDMGFDRSRPDEGCVIENTAGGRAVQTRFGKVEASEIIIVPDLPAPPQPWNNEHTVSVSTRYSERGTLRTGTYARKLRSPLTVHGLGSPNPPAAGILTDNSAFSHVSINGGLTSADTRLRVQAVLDLQEERMLFSLLDMKEGGAAGAAVSVPQNGEYILPGYAGSPVSSIEITVNNYAALWDMIRNSYGGRLVDVLDVRVA